jgi:hypothetical protein
MTYSRKDKNQDEIVEALEDVGASVCKATQLGGGAPDLLVGFRGRNYFIEVKNPDTGYDLSPKQERWHADWRGHVYVARTVDEALTAIGAI